VYIITATDAQLLNDQACCKKASAINKRCFLFSGKYAILCMLKGNNRNLSMIYSIVVDSGTRVFTASAFVFMYSLMFGRG
jgi:hypothetical protein